MFWIIIEAILVSYVIKDKRFSWDVIDYNLRNIAIRGSKYRFVIDYNLRNIAIGSSKYKFVPIMNVLLFQGNILIINDLLFSKLFLKALMTSYKNWAFIKFIFGRVYIINILRNTKISDMNTYFIEKNYMIFSKFFI